MTISDKDQLIDMMIDLMAELETIEAAARDMRRRLAEASIALSQKPLNLFSG